MRIIGGALKGKSIYYLKNSITRPLKDSVKENIFNILQHSNLLNINIEGTNVLDLYSGIGSFGIECISRGASKITFIEQDKMACKFLKKNLNNLSIIKRSNIFNNNTENSLSSLQKEKFDLIFLDPPFKDKNFISNLELIKKYKMFKTKTLIILHREKKIKDDLEHLINIILVKEYGRSKIIFGFLI